MLLAKRSIQSWKFYLGLFWAKLNRDEISDRASVFAFQAILSLIPIIAISYSVFSFSGALSQWLAEIENFLLSYVAPSMGQQVIVYLHTLQEKVSPRALGLFGILGLMWTGTNMLARAEANLNQIWGVRRARGFFQRLGLYSLCLVLAPIVLVASFALTSLVVVLTESLARSLGPLGGLVILLLTVLPVLVSAAFFSFVYWALPHTFVHPRAAIRAGVITAVVLEILKQLYAFYAVWSLGSSLYGSLAALPILFLWFWLAAHVFLIGAEICYFFDVRETGVVRVSRAENQLSDELLADLLTLYANQDSALSNHRVTQILDWDQSEITRHLHYLVEHGFLRSERNSIKGRECFRASSSDIVKLLSELRRHRQRFKYHSLMEGEVRLSPSWT